MKTREYFRKMEYDMDPKDMALNERKLRKFYNLVQREKYPEDKLTKETQKLFRKLEQAIENSQTRFHQSSVSASIFDEHG